MPVPAEVMFDILCLGLTTNDAHTLRRCACLVLCYSWYNRADSGVLLFRCHVTFDDRGITVNVQGKTLPRNVACPIHRPLFARYDPLGLVLRLLHSWHATSAAWQRPGDVYWSLPLDSTVWRSSVIDAWLKQLLLKVGHSPPAGETWSGHSLRSGGASASLAICVNMFYIMHHRVWKSMAAVQRYLSLHVLPSPSAFLFFSWMLLRAPPPLG
jgi:hypothetical protein